MGKAIYCDRCKKLFNTEKDDIKKVIIKTEFYNDDFVVDICRSCMDKLESFIYGDDLKKKKRKGGKE